MNPVAKERYTCVDQIGWSGEFIVKLRCLARLTGAIAAVVLASPGFAQPADPAARCRQLTVPQGATQPEVVTAFELLLVDVSFEALATCRQALDATPSDATLIAGEDLATKVATVLALGKDFPPKREDAVARALALAPRASGFEAPLIAYYLGSAFAYGAGVPRDRAGSVQWFTKALQVGDPASAIVKTELARLQAGATPK